MADNHELIHYFLEFIFPALVVFWFTRVTSKRDSDSVAYRSLVAKENEEYRLGIQKSTELLFKLHEEDSKELHRLEIKIANEHFTKDEVTGIIKEIKDSVVDIRTLMVNWIKENHGHLGT